MSTIKLKDILATPLTEGSAASKLSRAKRGAKASGGGYSTWVKTGKDSWKNTKTGKNAHSQALADQIGTFNDFKITEELMREGKFDRLPATLFAMNDLKNSVDLMHRKHEHGEDYYPPLMKTIEAAIKNIKKSVKSFKDSELIKGTVYESINEALSPWKRFDKIQDLRVDSMNAERDMSSIEKQLNQAYKDMEQEADASGGKAANSYGTKLDKLQSQYAKKKAEFKKIIAKIDKLDSV